MAEMQIQVLAKAVVLGCEIDAGYCRREVKVGDKDATQSILVVYGKADPTAAKLTLMDLVEQCRTMVDFFKDEKEAKDHIVAALPPQAAKYLDSIEFTLKEVFFVKPMTELAAEGAPPPSETLSSEFAFWFDINFENMTQGWPVAVKGVSLKLWKTTNARILKEMNVSSMEELLGMAKTTSGQQALPEPE